VSNTAQQEHPRACVIWGEGNICTHSCCIVMGINATTTSAFQLVYRLANGVTIREHLSKTDFIVVYSQFARCTKARALQLAEYAIQLQDLTPAPETPGHGIRIDGDIVWGADGPGNTAGNAAVDAETAAMVAESNRTSNKRQHRKITIIG